MALAPSSSMNYIVTASKPTAVSHALVMPLLSSEPNLVVIKRTHLEVLRISSQREEEGAIGAVLYECALTARVVAAHAVTLPASPLQALLLVSERHRVTLLHYDVVSARLVTSATVDVREPLQSAGDVAPLSAYEASQRLLAVHHYTGQLKLIALAAPSDAADPAPLTLAEPVTLRIEEARVLDLAWIAPAQLAVLYEDAHRARHVRTYTLAPTRRALLEGPWSLPNVDRTAERLLALPVPLPGVLVLAADSAVFHAGVGAAPQSTALRRVRVRATCVVPGEPRRVLLADHAGRLHLLLVTQEGARVRLHTELLGTTVTASALAYLGDGLVFVGSALGDSECVRLSSTPLRDGSYVARVAVFPSLAPIVDMALVDAEQQGQAQIVACSGAFKDGSLRLVRYGVAVHEHARVELSGVKGMWALDAHAAPDAPEQHLVLAFADETRVLALRDEELSEREPGSHALDATQSTLLCATLDVDAATRVLVQVTPAAALLCDPALTVRHAHWAPPAPHARITAAAPVLRRAPAQVVVACAARVSVVRATATTLTESAHTVLEHDVSALATMPHANLVAATLWGDFSLRLLRLDTLAPLQRVDMRADTIARSLLFAPLGDEWQLFAALGDGQLVSYALDADHLVREDSRKAVTLGTRPLQLQALPDTGQVLVCGDRPSLVSRTAQGRVQYAQVNLRELAHACPLRARAFPGALALATGDALLIGALAATQRLHERSVPLGELARRIVHVEHARAYAAATLRLEVDAQGREEERGSVRLWSAHTLEALDAYALLPREMGNALLCAALGADAPPASSIGGGADAASSALLIVGTTIDSGDAALPERGRVLVFEVRAQRLVLVAELALNGAVFALEAVRGRLVAAVNNEVHVYRWERSQDGAAARLVHECSARGFKLALTLAVRGDLVLVADLIKSVVVLRYENGALKELARDYAPAWTVTAALQDDERVLVSENGYNLYALRRHADALSDEERARLDLAGEFHLGDQINRMRHGALVLAAPGADALRVPTLVLGALSGAVYVCALLDAHPTLYAQLESLQRAMQRSAAPQLAPLGGMRHDEWRAFENERRIAPARGFLDGDLLESFLDLPESVQHELAQSVVPPVSASELVQRLETLARALH